ncbi:hypothetical protein BLOT_015355 [Blomia tropicalis]|nr:hypothetical protein BLOT_015355 [Blomia tropicalis]
MGGMEPILKSKKHKRIQGPNAGFARVRFWVRGGMEFIPKSKKHKSQTQASPKSITIYGVNVSYAKALVGNAGAESPLTSLKVLILPKKNDFDLRFSGLLKNYTADLLSFSLFEKSTKFPIHNCIKSLRLLFDLTLTAGQK